MEEEVAYRDVPALLMTLNQNTDSTMPSGVRAFGHEPDQLNHFLQAFSPFSPSWHQS